MVEMTYQVVATPEGRGWWNLRVPQIERSTQARSVAEIPEMVKDLIEIMTGESDATIEVVYQTPGLQDHLDRLAQARQAEDLARAQAAAELRAAAKTLRDQDLTLKDVGAVLGVSHQRAAQLLKTAA
jgi:DNA-directed RNA polymerase specialized sigma subunit